MAITSIGYGGTVDETNWAILAPGLGPRGERGLVVTAGGTGDRAITIGTGNSWGNGVIDTSNTAVVKNLATVSSGTRWDTVVLRRDWSGDGGTTTFEVNQGGSAESLTLAFNTVGVKCDYPLATVQVTAGSTAVTAIHTQVLRPTPVNITPGTTRVGLFGNGRPVGSIIAVPGTDPKDPVILYSLQDDGSWQDLADRRWTACAGGSGISSKLRYRIVGNLVYLQGTLTKNNGGFNGSDAVIATLPAEARPSATFRIPLAISGHSDQTPTSADIRSTGQILAYNLVGATNTIYISTFYDRDNV